jgi:hypothetical protein
MSTKEIYPKLIPGGIYYVDCNSAGNGPNDWVGVCRVINVIEANHIFFVERLEGITDLLPEEDGATCRVGIESKFHKAMVLIDNPLEDIKINISINDLL